MIHQYKSNGYNIVMDVNGGAVHVVDDIVYDMIPLVEPLVMEGIKDIDTVKAAVLNCAGLPYKQEDEDSFLLRIFMKIIFLILKIEKR